MLTALALAASVSLVAIGTAQAADLANRQVYKAPPLAPTFSWTGFYVGAHVGYGWGGGNWDSLAATSPNNNGVIGGGQIGYNWQVAPTWVLGLEGDFSGSGMKGSSTCYPGSLSCSADANWLATMTGRAGYTFDHAMLYAKGGAAFINEDFAAVGGLVNATATQTRTGWTVGGGLEYAFAPAWSAKIEYDYMDFGSKATTFTPGTTNINQTVNAVKVGVNYRLGSLDGR
jgi:outer membrane immunogenic protein